MRTMIASRIINFFWKSNSIPLFLILYKKLSARYSYEIKVQRLYSVPTLVDLCGLPAEPHVPLGGPSLSGFSLRPFLEDPSGAIWEGPPVCLTSIRGPLDGAISDCAILPSEEDPHFSVCSDRYRYTFCNNGEEELYDHKEEPNEWTNLAGDSDSKEIAGQLRAEMKKILDKSGYTPAHPATVVP
jgi:hypothetical protein